MRELAILTSSIILIMACTSRKEPPIDKYFDVPGFINQQIEILNQRNAQLNKKVRFGNDQESLTVSDLDLSQWQKEFRIFKEHDINKPVLVDAYTIDQGMNHLGNKTSSYHLIDSTGSGILKMQITYDSKDQVSTWSSSFQEENLLYCNFRELTLTTGEEGILDGYRVNGYHKLMFKDTVYYQLEAEISY